MQTHCGFPLLIMRGVVVSRVATVPFKILLDAGFLLSRVDYTMERSIISAGKSPQQPRVFEVSKHRGCWAVSMFVWYPMQPQQPRVFEVFRNTAGLFQSLFGNPKRCDFIKQKTAGCQASEPNLALQRRRLNRVFP